MRGNRTIYSRRLAESEVRPAMPSAHTQDNSIS
jgi:hypothetical protein